MWRPPGVAGCFWRTRSRVEKEYQVAGDAVILKA